MESQRIWLSFRRRFQIVPYFLQANLLLPVQKIPVLKFRKSDKSAKRSRKIEKLPTDCWLLSLSCLTQKSISKIRESHNSYQPESFCRGVELTQTYLNLSLPGLGDGPSVIWIFVRKSHIFPPTLKLSLAMKKWTITWNSAPSSYPLHHFSRSWHLDSRLSFCRFEGKGEENWIFLKPWRVKSPDWIFDEDCKSELTFLLRCLLPKIQSLLTIDFGTPEKSANTRTSAPVNWQVVHLWKPVSV